MTRSEFACRQSIVNLQGSLYMWTFTLIYEIDIRKAAEMWSRLAQDLLKRRLGFAGVRTFELHPGGHGLHVHVITNRYYDVNRVRAALVGTCWGRIDVQSVGREDALYVAKYVGKAKCRPELKGMRLWGCFGIPQAYKTRVKDIECISARGECYKTLAKYAPVKSGRDRFRVMTAASEMYSTLTPERGRQLYARSILRVVETMLEGVINEDFFEPWLDARRLCVEELRDEAAEIGLLIGLNDQGTVQIRKAV